MYLDLKWHWRQPTANERARHGARETGHGNGRSIHTVKCPFKTVHSNQFTHMIFAV